MINSKTHLYRSKKEKEMNTNKITGIDPKVKPSFRMIAIITGVVFIIATVATLLAGVLEGVFGSVLTGAEYLTSLSANANQMTAGALLYIISYFASAGIAVVMYPVLKKWNAGLALGSVIFRTIEAAFYMVGVVCLLSLLTLGQQFTSAVAADRTSLQAIGGSLVSVHNHAGLLAVFAFCLGAFMY
jgi:hypothetical protein